MKAKRLMHFCMVVLMASMMISCFARCAHIKFDGSDVTDFSYEDTKFGEKTNYIKVIKR